MPPTIDPDAAADRVPMGTPGNASVSWPVDAGASVLAIGVQGLTDGELRVELALAGEQQDDTGLVWFDQGRGLDITAAQPSVQVPVAGFLAIRLVVQTAAAEQALVYLGRSA